MSQNQPSTPDRPADAPGFGQPDQGNPAERPQTPGQGHPDRDMPTENPAGNPAERTYDRPDDAGMDDDAGLDDNSLSDLRDDGDNRV